MTKSTWQQDPWRTWYGSNRWKKRRRQQLREHPLCALCLGKGRVVPATVADHTEAHKGDWNAFLLGPLQSLCANCHNGTKKFVEQNGYYPDIGLDGWPIDRRHPCYRRG